jgi:cell division protein FtsW
LAVALLGLGLVMIASSSISIADRGLGDPFYYFDRQLVYAVASVAAAAAVYHIPLVVWERSSAVLLLVALVLLVLVLIPGLAPRINGSERWVGLGPIHVQVSEPARLLILMYLAGYMVRHQREVTSQFLGFLKPMLVLGIAGLLLIAEPDFGAATVLLATAFAMLFLGGARLRDFSLFAIAAVLVLLVLAVSSPYRMERLTAFMNPWAHPFDQGFQLTQSLIAIGRGQWLGAGLGESVQKLFYLPEAYTDFVFAVLAEELGLWGTVLVIGLYLALVWRALSIARRAAAGGRMFGAYLAFGLGAWIGLQAFINIAVNMGALPTKGLTLPLMSFGGSSLIVTCIAIGLLLRVEREGQRVRRPAWRARGAVA